LYEAIEIELQGSEMAISKKKRLGSSSMLISKKTSAPDFNDEVEGVHVEVLKNLT